MLQATLAVDYWIAQGYRPRVFQADSFAWFIALLGCVYGLLVCVLRPSAGATDPRLPALAATAVFALHPAGAETVNYVIQRGEILSTLGVVSALLVYARWPHLRRFGLWVPFVVFGALAKPPALIQPALMGCYLAIVERPTGASRRQAWRDLAIAVVVAAASGWWLSAHTPPAFTTGAASSSAYWLSQPFVTLRYFAAFFAPINLSADNDWTAVHRRRRPAGHRRHALRGAHHPGRVAGRTHTGHPADRALVSAGSC